MCVWSLLGMIGVSAPVLELEGRFGGEEEGLVERLSDWSGFVDVSRQVLEVQWQERRDLSLLGLRRKGGGMLEGHSGNHLRIAMLEKRWDW